MKELIAKLEAATGPDKALDAAIANTLERGGWHSNAGSEWPTPSPYPFTASIDYALHLLPPWSWRVGNLPSGRGFADLGTQASLQNIEGATPAIALCIAALKARSTANASSD